MNHQEIVDTLNRLIEAAKDGEQGLEVCAEQAPGMELRALLGAAAQECRRAADELQMLVREHGGFAHDHGSAAAALHRGWQTLKSKLGTVSDTAVLEAAQHSAQRTDETYREALQNALPMILRVVVERQHEALKRQHAQLRAMSLRVRPHSPDAGGVLPPGA